MAVFDYGQVACFRFFVSSRGSSVLFEFDDESLCDVPLPVGLFHATCRSPCVRAPRDHVPDALVASKPGPNGMRAVGFVAGDRLGPLFLAGKAQIGVSHHVEKFRGLALLAGPDGDRKQIPMGIGQQVDFFE